MTDSETDDTRLAFAHPAERAAAMADPNAPHGPLDRISVRDHMAEVEIGAFEIERNVTQRLRFNVVVEVRAVGPGLDDDVDGILSYDAITEAITSELAAERLNLLETLAERIAARILAEPQSVRVFVRIEKLDRGPGALGVEIVRSDVERATSTPESNLNPQVVYFPTEALRSGRLTEWVDTFVALDRPIVIAVGAATDAIPAAATEAATRRIALLAADQNAWVCAAQDSRLMVANSRTELDWAMKNARICVWAPARVVLDATDAPDTVDGLVLANWLARELAGAPGAGKVLVFDAQGPKDII